MFAYHAMMQPNNANQRSKKDNLRALIFRVDHHGGGPFRLKLTPNTTGTSEERKMLQQSLSQNTRILSVDLRVMHMPNQGNLITQSAIEEMYQVLADVGNLPNMSILKISGYCEAFPVAVLTNLLQKATNLTTLVLTSVKFCGNQTEVKAFSEAVATHASLADLRLLDCQMVRGEGVEFDSHFLDIILEGVAASPRMDSLSLSPTRPNSMGNLSTYAIQNCASLKSLRLGSIGTLFEQDTKTNRSPFEALMTLLASNQTNLAFLYVPFHAETRNCQAAKTMLIHNTTLQELALRTFTDYAGNDLGLVAQALRINSTLLGFELLGPMRVKDPALLQEFAQVLEVNYALHDLVLFELVVHAQHNATMSYQAKLNQHGRKHWLEEMYANHHGNDATKANNNTKVQNSLAFLQQLAQDPDDVYYYLSRMNPSFLENLTSSG